MKTKRFISLLPALIVTTCFCLSCTTENTHTSSSVIPSTPLATAVVTSPPPLPTPLEESATDSPSVYADPNGLFTVAVPSGWALDGASPVVTSALSTAVWQFVGQVDGAPRQIVLGRSNQFIEEGSSLQAWTEQHDSGELRKERLETTQTLVNELEAVAYRARLPDVNRTLMQTNIKCGTRVWFVSTFLEDEPDDEQIKAYEQFVGSFRPIC